MLGQLEGCGQVGRDGSPSEELGQVLVSAGPDVSRTNPEAVHGQPRRPLPPPPPPAAAIPAQSPGCKAQEQ